MYIENHITDASVLNLAYSLYETRLINYKKKNQKRPKTKAETLSEPRIFTLASQVSEKVIKLLENSGIRQ